jgi:hypothetical protein
MSTVLMDEIVETDYGQFDLVWTEDGGFDGDQDRFFAGQVNGLVGAGDPSGVYVNLGRRSGGSQVRVVLHDVEPHLPGPEYDDIVEVSTTVPDDAEPGWQSWAGESGGDLTGLGPGTYRLRVSARGRDAGAADEFAEGPVDFYLLELWPASAAPDEIVRVTSQNAAYWHDAWGGRR